MIALPPSRMMNKVQKIIDENQYQMPSGLTKQLEEAVKEEAVTRKSLHKLTWTIVNSHAHVVVEEDEPDFADVKLSHKMQTLIVEEVDHRPITPGLVRDKISAMELPNHGMVLNDWVMHFKTQPFTPLVVMPCDETGYGRTDYMVVVNSIVPYESHKRARGDDDPDDE